MFAHFSIRNSSIEVFVHLAHQLEHLLLRDCESHALEHVVELVDFDVVVFVIVDLVKNLLQSKAPLLQNFDQVVENFVLCLDLLSFRMQRFDFIFIVGLIERLQFSKLNDTVFIRIDFLEQRPHLQRFQAQVEVFA
jgi:hypothetical protein